MFSSRFSEPDHRPEIEEVRLRIFDWILVPVLLLGFVATFFGSLQAFQQKQWTFSVLYCVCYFAFAGVSIVGRSSPLVIRSLFLVLTLFVISVAILIRVGLSGIGLELLLFCCAVSSVFLGRRSGLMVAAAGVLAMVAVSVSMISGFIPFHERQLLTSLSPLAWATATVAFSMVSVALVMLPQMFLSRLKASLRQLEENTELLQQSNREMKRVIASRDEVEQALRESEEKYRILVENAGDAICIAQNGRLGFANRRLAELTEYAQEELTGILLTDLVHEDHRSMVLQRHVQRHESPTIPINYAFKIVKKSGTIAWVEVNVVKITWMGEPATLNFLRDISERVETERRLRESEENLARMKKMESLGLLAGGVAHDLNNVLSGIVSYPELLLLDLPADSKLRKPIETIQSAGERATAIVADLLTIARGVATSKEILNLNALITDFLNAPEFARLKRGHPGVKIETEFDEHLHPISGSPIHVTKLVMNLVSNAAEAIESHGCVRLSTANRYLDAPLKGYDRIDVGEYAVVSVSDDGPGITARDLDRIFEPFYSKKVMGRSGTGLGLAVVWNVVQDHGAYIDVASDRNGSRFDVYFPITRGEVADVATAPTLEAFMGTGEYIVVVDDVESQRDITRNMLEVLGYRVTTLASGEEAVDYFRHHDADLVLLDMIMDPGINGRETFERIRTLRPKQKAVIVSGFAETKEVKSAQKSGAGPYLKKPLTLRLLAQALRDALSRDREPEP